MTPPASFFSDIADDPALGGKARSLARLRHAGLPTPLGFVVNDNLFRALTAGAGEDPAQVAKALIETAFPPGFSMQLAARVGALGAARLSVRSSFATEDRAGEVAAGIFESRIGITAAEVPGAVREVLASALAPAALAYASGPGAPPAEPPIAVLVHAFVPGDAHGGAAGWRDDGSTATIVDVLDGAPSETARKMIVEALNRLTALYGPTEIEWVSGGEAVTFLQARPYSPPAPPRAWPGFRTLPADEDPAAWTWDAAHNPLPLSTAHAGLVALVDARCRIGLRQRVLGGYLFFKADPLDAPPAIAPSVVTETLATLAAEIDREVAALPQGDLEAALEVFVRHYEPLLGVVQPAARKARDNLARFLDRYLPAPEPPLPAGVASLKSALAPALLAGVTSCQTVRIDLATEMLASDPARAQLARDKYLLTFGDEALAWDLSAPTLRERPGLLPPVRTAAPDSPVAPRPTRPAKPRPWSEVLDEIASCLSVDLRNDFAALVTEARAGLAAGENDDWIYARLQAPIRRAILVLADVLVGAGALVARDDVFDLSLDRLRALAAGFKAGPAGVPPDLRAEAATGRAARLAALADPPPLAPGRVGVNLVRGYGCGGRAVGPVVLRHGPAGQHPPRDAILVATSLLPTELPLLNVAALVTETGGPLGHVATQARERALPAVVGAAGAAALFRDGDLAIVDGATGTVVRANR